MRGGIAGGKACNLLITKVVQRPAKPWTPVF